ncbi:MAG: NADH-quinone oxidoreductase subunit L [Anaerolineales bacterium]|nr:NADH-quinone oxidoreductase subunit L [Anaerolineales bacterium]
MYLSEIATGGPQYFDLAPWVLFFPLLGLLVNLIAGGRLPEKVIGTVASTASGLAFVVAVLQAISLIGHPEGAVIPLADWIAIDDLRLRWALQVDTLSVTMMLVVAGVGTLIHIYAVAYMHEDVRINGDPTRYRRFFVFFNLFILAMMVLVSADNYLMLFVGWEGVGLCSYLLIGFWYDKGKDGIGNAVAGKKAFIVNRIGDFGFLIAAFVMFSAFRTFQFEGVFTQAPEVAMQLPAAIVFITFFMLLGVAGKSAQIPLHVWLPDAMAGPTPVSALIHAATMVTAGVYLVARSHPLYVLVPSAQTAVALVGGLTALLAATIAVAQFDIKRVLAYSTISQLGFMVSAVGMGAFTAGMFHLVTHAFFKALLFLSAGSVIQGVEHGLHHVEHDPSLKKKLGPHPHDYDPQDMRNMGGLRTRMKTTFWVYLIGALALAGIAPLAGFWSKDEILAEASVLKPGVYWLLTAAAFFTAFYIGRQVLMVFFGKPRSEPAAHAKENPPLMTVPLIILAGLSLLGGALNLPGVHTFGHWLEHTIRIEAAVKEIYAAGRPIGEFNPLVAGVSTLLALLALFLAWWIYGRRGETLAAHPTARAADDPLRQALGPLFTLLHNKYYVDELYGYIVVEPYQALSRFLAEVVDWAFWHDWFHDSVLAGGYRWLTRLLAVRIDLGIIDAIANGLGEATRWASQLLRRVQTGYVRNYALSVFFGVVLILGYLILR